MLTVECEDAKTWVGINFDHLCALGLLELELKVLLRCRRVSRGWRGALNHALPLLRLVSFPVSVTGEGAKRTLGLVAGGNLQSVSLALCRELSARDIEEILKLLHATCPGVREVDITGCSDEAILRALAVCAMSTLGDSPLGASPLRVHECLMALAGGSARSKARPAASTAISETDMQRSRLPGGRRNRQTALHRVAQQGCPDPLLAVLSAGANVNAKDNKGDTPLLIASKRGLCGVVELLLAAGADVAAKNKAGYTSVWLAMEQKRESAVEVLLQAIGAAGKMSPCTAHQCAGH